MLPNTVMNKQSNMGDIKTGLMTITHTKTNTKTKKNTRTKIKCLTGPDAAEHCNE